MNVFTSKGTIDTSIDPQMIPEDRRAQFVALAAAQTACEQADADEKAANDKVTECVRVHNETMARVPKQTHTALVKEALGLR